MKNKLIRNILISGVLSFLLLTLFCFFYYNIPIHNICEDKVTDYVWQKNKFYMLATEGISWGRTNNEGYVNAYDYNLGDNVDVLIMGSSQLEGFSVKQDENAAVILADKLHNDVYNISTSGHNFKVCLSNLEYALAKYKPKIVVIETNRLEFSNEEIIDIINNKRQEINSYNELIKFIQKNPFIRLSYEQIESFMNSNAGNDKTVGEQIINEEINLDDRLFAYINEICGKYSVKPIILFNPSVSIEFDGSLITDANYKNRNEFKRYCDSYDIRFVDMTERYISEYDNEKILPTGFCNTQIGTGHINKNGHMMIGDELYKVIKEME